MTTKLLLGANGLTEDGEVTPPPLVYVSAYFANDKEIKQQNIKQLSN